MRTKAYVAELAATAERVQNEPASHEGSEGSTPTIDPNLDSIGSIGQR